MNKEVQMLRCRWLLAIVISLAWVNLAQAVTPAQEATRLKLATRMAVYYENRPLREVLGDVAMQAGVEIVCDDASLRAEDVTPDTTVTLRITGNVSAKATLTVVLQQLRLTTTVRPDGVIEVVNCSRQVDLVEKVYDLSPGLIKASNKPQAAERTKADDQRQIQKLVKDLLFMIETDNWSQHGGWGTIAAIENDSAIVVNQSPRVHDVIQKLLAPESHIRQPRVVLTVEHLELSERVWGQLKRQRNAVGHSQISSTYREEILYSTSLENLYSTRSYLLCKDALIDVPVTYKDTTPPGAVAVIQLQASLQEDNQLRIAIAPYSQGRERFPKESFAVVPPGESLVIPVTDNIPGMTIHFEDGTRRLLMLTPRVVLPDSDENMGYKLRK